MLVALVRSAIRESMQKKLDDKDNLIKFHLTVWKRKQCITTTTAMKILAGSQQTENF